MWLLGIELRTSGRAVSSVLLTAEPSLQPSGGFLSPCLMVTVCCFAGQVTVLKAHHGLLTLITLKCSYPLQPSLPGPRPRNSRIEDYVGEPGQSLSPGIEPYHCTSPAG